MTTLDPLTKSPTAMAKTELDSCAGICPTHGFASYPKSLIDLSALSDTALQQRINDCAEGVLAAHRRYEATGCFADAGERDRLYHAEAAALIERGQRPHIVAQMEAERGLT